MPQTAAFDQALDAIEHLAFEEQEALIAVLTRRLAERPRTGGGNR